VGTVSEHDEELVRTLAKFRDVAEKEHGYVTEGAWHNSRVKGLAFKAGSSYKELWVQVYVIGDGPRAPLEPPVHFTGTFTAADMAEATYRKAERERGVRNS
jgi:hypothetical protein